MTICDAPLPTARSRWAGISPFLITVATFIAAAGLIAARRPGQIAFPEAWDEDGVFYVPLVIEHGWRFIFQPWAGYLIVPSKLVSGLAVWISFMHYPAVSTAIAIAAEAACVTVIARAPTVLPARMAMAAAVVFLPTNPETFALPLYTFWWTSLLLFVALLWSGAPQSPWRYLLVVIGGISSPTILVILPVIAVNAAVRRKRPDLLLLLAGAAVGAIQLYCVLTTDTSSAGAFHLRLTPLVISRFFGFLTAPGASAPLAAGLLLVSLVAAGVFIVPKEDRLSYILLGGCLAGTVASVVYRAPIGLLHPLTAGPRYFFHSTILTLWLVMWMAVRGRRPVNAVPVLLLVMVLPVSYRMFQRHQDRLAPWSVSARRCIAWTDTAFPIQIDGTRQTAAMVVYPHTICEKGVKEALFDRWSAAGQ